MKELSSRRYLLFVEQPYSFSILRPVQAEIRKQGAEVKWFLVNQSHSQLNSEEEFLSTTPEVLSYNPDAVIVPGNWVPHFFPGLKVQVFHGFGIDKKGHFTIRGFFDLYCTHGPLTTGWFQKKAEQKKFFRTIETGWPKMDPLFEKIDDRDETHEVPHILYAPTFSPSLTSSPALSSQFKEIAGSGKYQIRIKFHPLMKKQWKAEYEALENENLIIEHSDSFLPSLDWADVVISDTSSVVAESLCAGKPVITFKTRNPQGNTVDITDPAALPKTLQQVIESYPAFREKGKDYANQMHPYRDSNSSLRVLLAIEELLSGNLPAKKKPFNFFRKRKVIQKMQSYR